MPQNEFRWWSIVVAGDALLRSCTSSTSSGAAFELIIKKSLENGLLAIHLKKRLPLFFLLLLRRPMTIPDLPLFSEVCFKLRPSSKLRADAAPMTAGLDLEEGSSSDKGRRTSAPLAASPITNLRRGAGGSGRVFPVDPITNWKNRAAF